MDEIESWCHEANICESKRPDGTPRLLFKYLPAERVDVLKNNELRFTQPILFNDSFDGRPYFRNLPCEPQNVIHSAIVFERGLGQFSFSSYMERCVQLNSELSPRLRGDDLRQFLLDSICSVVGVLSLSENPLNPLMWGHYADSHRGFVVGFDTEVPFFRCGNPALPPSEGAFYPVRYAQDRPRRRSYEDVTATDAYFTKSWHWAYEQEWRQYRLITDADRTTANESDDIALFSFPRSAVRVVIIGMNMSSEYRQKIQSTLLMPLDYRYSAKTFRCSMDSRVYQLRLKKLSWSQ